MLSISDVRHVGWSELFFYNILRMPKLSFTWAMVVAQLVKQSLQAPLIRGSNPVVSDQLY